MRTAYHHVEIFDPHKTYLCVGQIMPRGTKYYVYVLQFDITTAGYIFKKDVRCIVKYLRNSGLKVIIYLYDGL